MKKRAFGIKVIVPVSLISLLFLFSKIEQASSQINLLPADVQDIPQVTGVDPDTAPNDLATTVTITGTGFAEGPPETLVYLGDTALEEVTWVSDTTLLVGVPWGMDPAVYTLTVVNPDGEAGSLPYAFTVTQGIGTLQTGGPYGGWVDSLVLGDSQGQTLYATVGNVGLFRSMDGSASWELIFIEIGHLNRPEVDPTNPGRLYISKYASGKTGLYLSEDGGDTWTAMPTPIPDIILGFFRAFVNPHNGTLYGALFSDLTDVLLGLFRFDEPNQTWIRLEESGLLDETTAVTAVGFDPLNPQIMYAGIFGGQVIQSTDAGQTWFSHSQSPLDNITELVVNPVGGELWMCGPGGTLPGGLYRYDGDEWLSMYSSPYYPTAVRNIILDPGAADPLNQQIWIAAVQDGLLKSEDGGQNWSSIGPGTEAVALNPLDPQTIYRGSPDGLSKTSDGGASWQPANEGLTGIVPSNLAVNPLNPAVIYGSAVGIFGSQDGGKSWQKLHEGGGPIVVDPANPQHVVVGTFIADDGWNFNRQSVIPLPPGMDPNKYQAIINSMIAKPGMWLLGAGYFNSKLPYFNLEGGAGIYLSADGENWVLVSQLQTCPPASFAFDPVDTNIFYAAPSGMFGGVEGTCKATFLRSIDGGHTWQESTTGLPPNTGGIIAINPEPPHHILLNGSYISLDQGVTWSEVNGLVNVRSMLFLPGPPSILYAGTYDGLFRTMDEAQTWQRASGVLGELEIWSMAGMASEERHILYVSTVGGDSDVLQTVSLVEGEEALVNAGVYRYTTTPWGYQIYLPDIMR